MGFLRGDYLIFHQAWAYGPGLHFAAYYSYGTNKGDLFTYSVDGMNNLGLRIGIAF